MGMKKAKGTGEKKTRKGRVAKAVSRVPSPGRDQPSRKNALPTIQRPPQPSKIEEMAGDPTFLRFSETHEWVKIKDRFTIVAGLAEFALNKLSDVLSVDLPEPDEHHYEAGDDVGIVEALNSSVTLHAPVSGRVVASNTALLTNPELICEDPYGRGWLFEMRPDSMEDVQELLDYDEYEGRLPEEEEE